MVHIFSKNAPLYSLFFYLINMFMVSEYVFSEVKKFYICHIIFSNYK